MSARYVLGRTGQAALVLWAAFTLTWAVLHLLPSDPAAIMLAANNVEIDSLTPAQVAVERARFGLDAPWYAQYASALVGALHGDFGTSFAKQVPVSQLLADRLPGTVVLSALAVGIAVVTGTVVAFAAAHVRWVPARLLLDRLPAVGASLPSFWVALLLIQVFAFGLGWFPATGDQGWRTLVLPAVTMAIPTAAVLAQVLTRGLHDVMAQPWVTTARAKGLSRAGAQLHHGLRNAALPALTLLGLLVGATVTGAVVTETVFSRNGIGRLAQESVLAQDVPVVLAIVTVAAAAFVLVNLVVDLLYPLLDPRVTHTPEVSRA